MVISKSVEALARVIRVVVALVPKVEAAMEPEAKRELMAGGLAFLSVNRGVTRGQPVLGAGERGDGRDRRSRKDREDGRDETMGEEPMENGAVQSFHSWSSSISRFGAVGT
jgi:hypothetical protein